MITDRPAKQDPNSAAQELKQALEHLDRRAAGSVVLERAVHELEQLPPRDTGNKINRERRARAHVHVAHALYEAGRVTKPEFVYFVAYPLISLVHDSRWTDGEYNEDLNPLSDRMGRIEAEHGLASDEFWLHGEGPPEHQELNRAYEAVLDRKQGEVFREFGEPELARLWDVNPSQFDVLFEQGRAAVADRDDWESGLVELIRVYEREAESCADAAAYYSACVFLGAAMEARLLLQCVQNPTALQSAIDSLPRRRRPRSPEPRAWGLKNLLEVCGAAGWLPSIDGELASHHPEGWGHLLRDLRNLVHPSQHFRTRPRTIISVEELADAQSAYTLIKTQLGSQNPQNPSPQDSDLES